MKSTSIYNEKKNVTTRKAYTYLSKYVTIVTMGPSKHN